MYKYLYIALFCSFSFFSLNAETINKININGNKRISTETIKIYGEIELNKNYSESDTNKILKNLYKTDFFEQVEIEIIEDRLIITVKEYPFINQLLIVGEKSNNYKDQIKKIIKLKEKRSFIKSYLSEDLETIKSLYSSRGYNSAEIDIKTKKITNNSFDLLVEINRGDKTKISSINFIGNNKIKSRRLKDVIASEEDKFWKILTNNTNFNQRLLELDTRLLRNFYKSNGFYDVKINS